jgi:hypothetical protein
VPPITWKISAYEDLNALVLRLAWIRCSRKAKDDLKERLTRTLWAVSQSTTPSQIAERVRQLTAEIEALERSDSTSKGTNQKS